MILIELHIALYVTGPPIILKCSNGNYLKSDERVLNLKFASAKCKERMKSQKEDGCILYACFEMSLKLLNI